MLLLDTLDLDRCPNCSIARPNLAKAAELGMHDVRVNAGRGTYPSASAAVVWVSAQAHASGHQVQPDRRPRLEDVAGTPQPPRGIPKTIHLTHPQDAQRRTPSRPTFLLPPRRAAGCARASSVARGHEPVLRYACLREGTTQRPGAPRAPRGAGVCDALAHPVGRLVDCEWHSWGKKKPARGRAWRDRSAQGRKAGRVSRQKGALRAGPGGSRLCLGGARVGRAGRGSLRRLTSMSYSRWR